MLVGIIIGAILGLLLLWFAVFVSLAVNAVAEDLTIPGLRFLIKRDIWYAALWPAEAWRAWRRK